MSEQLNPYQPPVESGVKPQTPDSMQPPGTERSPTRDFGFAVFLMVMVVITMVAFAMVLMFAAA